VTISEPFYGQSEQFLENVARWVKLSEQLQQQPKVPGTRLERPDGPNSLHTTVRISRCNTKFQVRRPLSANASATIYLEMGITI